MESKLQVTPKVERRIKKGLFILIVYGQQHLPVLSTPCGIYFSLGNGIQKSCRSDHMATAAKNCLAAQMIFKLMRIVQIRLSIGSFLHRIVQV